MKVYNFLIVSHHATSITSLALMATWWFVASLCTPAEKTIKRATIQNDAKCVHPKVNGWWKVDYDGDNDDMSFFVLAETDNSFQKWFVSISHEVAEQPGAARVGESYLFRKFCILLGPILIKVFDHLPRLVHSVRVQIFVSDKSSRNLNFSSAAYVHWQCCKTA